jgi:hypothetical protein
MFFGIFGQLVLLGHYQVDTDGRIVCGDDEYASRLLMPFRENTYDWGVFLVKTRAFAV